MKPLTSGLTKVTADMKTKNHADKTGVVNAVEKEVRMISLPVSKTGPPKLELQLGRKKTGKREATLNDYKRKVKKDKKAKRDPNKPKGPPSAFFVFLKELRKAFKKENPNVKNVSAVGKVGGEKWKSMSATI